MLLYITCLHVFDRCEMKTVDPELKFLTMDEEILKSYYFSWYPGGSGPIRAMRTICSLIEAIATLRGFDVTKWGT